MGSGPRAGLAEIRLPELQKGSSIMPGKVNPVIPEVTIQVADQVIGNDAAISIAGTQGQFELNVRVPLIARNLLVLDQAPPSACRLLDTKCVSGASSPTARRCSSATRSRTLTDRDRAQPAHRLRQDDRDRQGGRRLRADGARGRARGRRRQRSILDDVLDQRKLARPHDR